MNDNVVIIGMTQFSEWVCQSINKEGCAHVVAFSAEKKYCTVSSFMGLPVIPIEELANHFDKRKTKLLVTVGYKKMNQVRERIFEEVKERGWSHYTYVSTSSIVDHSAVIEPGAIIMPSAYIGPNVHIGRGTIINVCAVLSHEIEIGDFCFIAPQAVFGGNSTVGKNCFIGLNSTIMNGVRIEDFNLIGASACISKNTVEYGCYIASATKRMERFKSTDIIDMV